MRSILFFFLCVSLPITALAADYFVAPNGNDSNSGAIGAPFRTFLPALRAAMPGDTIYARGGTYGIENTMPARVERINSTAGATSCPAGQALADGLCWMTNRAFIALQDFAAWATPYPAYSVRNGTESNPITIRNYPGETPILDTRPLLRDPLNDGYGFCMGSKVTNGCLASAIFISLKAYWVIEGLEIIGGAVNMGGGNTTAQTHDITLRGNNIHDVTVDGGDNTGLVRIDRGDFGGPYNIRIHDNTLHGLYDWEFPNQYANVPDMQHFGAVTALSAQNYVGYDAGGTGRIEIIGNHIYNVPQAFFFKNAMHGPIEIRNNIIHHCGSLGDMVASNVSMVNNLSYATELGFWKVGWRNLADPRINAISGQNAIITNNTFVDMSELFGIRNGVGHRVTNNIFFGMTSPRANADYSSKPYIAKTEIEADTTDPSQSILKTITSNNNCFITPRSDFLFIKRHGIVGGGSDYFSYQEARPIFGLDLDSIFIVNNNSAQIFVNPAQADYRLLNPELCPNMGYSPSGVDTTPPAAPIGLGIQ